MAENLTTPTIFATDFLGESTKTTFMSCAMLSSAAKIIPYSNSFTLCSSTARKELLIMQPGCSLISMQPIKAGYTPNATS